MIELRKLVEVALQRFGCQLEAVEENLFHAAIPTNSPVRQILDVGESAYLALVQFEEDRLAGLDPVRHLIPGSIYLERFIGILTEHGTVGDVTLHSMYDRPGDLSVCSFLMDAVSNAGGCEVAASEAMTHRCVTFHFVVDLFAIEASKTLVSITFDFDSHRLIANVDTGRLPDAGPAVVEVASTELKGAAGAVMESVRAEACRQIELYADEHGSERTSARKRLQRLARKRLDGDDGQPVHLSGVPLDEERDEIARDWEQRIRHADSQYKAEGAQITLVSATRQLRPFARYSIRFPARKEADGLWEVLYDLTCGNFLLPLCNSCGSAAGRLAMGEGLCSHPLCDRCVETRPACQHRACKACVRKCVSCPATMCRGCNSECDYSDCLLTTGSSGLCDKHKRLCAKCELCVCGQHRQFCKSCQRTFCSLCYNDHQWKRADCGHLLDCGSKLKVCRICANTLCTVCTEQCRQCGRYACNEHTVKCFVCSSNLCDKHKVICSKCENFICAQHRRFCRNCQRIFCSRCHPNHGWKRADCGHQISCSFKPSLCHVCKDSLCAACTERCQHCERFVCHEHTSQCIGCRLQVCERCTGLGCVECAARCCKEHSFSCKVCARHICNEHAQWCAVCKRALCGDHVRRCLSCLRVLCLKHGKGDEAGVLLHCVICESEAESSLQLSDCCEKDFPPKLLHRRSGDDQLICIECGAKCSECKTWALEFEFGKCTACGKILCNECLGQHFYECDFPVEEHL